MAEILIGTCGYSYNEWIGPVYPEGAKQKEFLGLYAAKFPTVELDFSYYAMPSAPQLAKMLEGIRNEEGRKMRNEECGMRNDGREFTFSIKAHKSLTHEVNPSQWEGEAKTYLQAIEPLREAGRLEAVLFQFPYSFHYEAENRRYLDKLLTAFKGVPAAVEFRTADWFTGRVIEGMKSRGIPLVSLDMPEVKGLPPLMDVVTADTAYIRLHGRNKESWWGSDTAARYDYLYTDKEIEAWAARIERIVEQAHRILVYFNNHPKGKAAQNAATLIKKLGMRN
ncbi:hypothetical protein FACS1894161_3010 [Spirochaetia bacterium]|nr:hypothetical protein FACS1894161_3010 [Spirochaetia bacterium]